MPPRRRTRGLLRKKWRKRAAMRRRLRKPGMRLPTSRKNRPARGNRWMRTRRRPSTSRKRIRTHPAGARTSVGAARRRTAMRRIWARTMAPIPSSRSWECGTACRTSSRRAAARTPRRKTGTMTAIRRRRSGSFPCRDFAVSRTPSNTTIPTMRTTITSRKNSPTAAKPKMRPNRAANPTGRRQSQAALWTSRRRRTPNRLSPMPARMRLTIPLTTISRRTTRRMILRTTARRTASSRRSSGCSGS